MENLNKTTSNMDSTLKKIFFYFTTKYHKQIRLFISLILLTIFISFLIYFIIGIMPQTYYLKISGGRILSSNHYISTMIAKDSEQYGVHLKIYPDKDSDNPLQSVNSGKLDVCVINAGMEMQLPNLTKITTLLPETLHLLVKPESNIKELKDLRGKTVYYGAKNSELSVVVRKVLEYEDLYSDIDFVEQDIAKEKMVLLPKDSLPDAIFIMDLVPSTEVKYFIKNRGFVLVEIPVPSVLTQKYSWVAEVQIPPYSYNTSPAIPPKSITTIGINMHIVANSKVDPRAIEKLLEVIYDPKLANQIHQNLDPNLITAASIYPISKGSFDYLNRNKPLISQDNVQKLSSMGGFLMTFFAGISIFYKWFIGKPIFDDDEYVMYLEKIASLEKQLADLQLSHDTDLEVIRMIASNISEIQRNAVQKYPNATLKDPSIINHVLSSANNALQHINILMNQTKTIIVNPQQMAVPNNVSNQANPQQESNQDEKIQLPAKTLFSWLRKVD